MKRRKAKRTKLIVSNVIAFVVLLIVSYIEGIFGYWLDETLFKYVMAMFAFTIMSLIVYYLSLIADAISQKAGAVAKKPVENPDEQPRENDWKNAEN